MSSQESQLLPVLLGEADEALPLLGVGADGLAELGDDLLDSIRFKRPSARRQRERDLKHAQATQRERERERPASAARLPSPSAG